MSDKSILLRSFSGSYALVTFDQSGLIVIAENNTAESVHESELLIACRLPIIAGTKC
jgi:hypothetical protein